MMDNNHIDRLTAIPKDERDINIVLTEISTLLRDMHTTLMDIHKLLGKIHGRGK